MHVIYCDIDVKNDRLSKFREMCTNLPASCRVHIAKYAYEVDCNEENETIIFSYHRSNFNYVKVEDRKKESEAYNKLRSLAQRSGSLFIGHSGDRTEEQWDESQQMLICRVTWLENNIIGLANDWQQKMLAQKSINTKEYVEDFIKKSAVLTSGLANSFISLDILIQGLLTIIGIAENKDSPWWWMEEEEREKVGKIEPKLNKDIVNRNWGSIKEDPCSWFKAAVGDLKEIFPNGYADKNERLRDLLSKLPDAKRMLYQYERILLPPDGGDVDLIKLSKIILKCSIDDDRIDKANECKELTNAELLKGAHKIYTRICH